MLEPVDAGIDAGMDAGIDGGTDTGIDAEVVRRLAALNGLHLEPERAAVLMPFVAGLAAADARLAALDLGTLPAAGLPWEPFTDLLAPASANHESAGAHDRR